MKLKYLLPNLLTLFRLCGGIALLFLEPLSLPFYIVYSVSGFSDAIDGPIARHFDTVSDFGATLDSISDLIFYAAAAFRIFPALLEALPLWIWWWVAAILIIRLAAYLTAFIKYRRFASIHSYLNKITGFCIFLSPYFVVQQSFFTPYCILVGVVATLSSSEELFIHLFSKEYKQNKNSLFGRK